MLSKFLSILVCAVALSVLPGCHDDCCCERGAVRAMEAVPPSAADHSINKESTPSPTVAPGMPKVAGKWIGRWESVGHKGHGGGLTCEASEVGPQKWEAVFTAEFGQTKSYNVKLQGHPGEGAVLFGGKVDLGAK